MGKISTGRHSWASTIGLLSVGAALLLNSPGKVLASSLQIQPEPYEGVGEQVQLELAADFQKRRQVGWQVGWQVLKPARQQQQFGFQILHPFASVWQTWYSKDEIERILLSLGPDDQLTEHGLTEAAARLHLQQVKRNKAPDFDPAPLTGGFQLFSPAVYNADYVLHILQNFRLIAACPVVTNELLATPPQSKTNHSNCMPEFPKHAVMMKLAFGEANKTGPNGPYYEGTIKDLSATGMAAVLQQSGDWLDAGVFQLDKTNAFMLKTPDTGKYYVLKGFHVVTKELRDWIWVTFTWQPQPEQGLGRDRPAYIKGQYRHYVMGITVHELELDSQAGTGADGRLLFPEMTEAFRRFTNRGALISWNSNPFIEGPDSTSNCISCHQGQFATGKFGPHTERKHFPFDYTFGTQNPEALLMPRVSFRKAINQAAKAVATP